MDLTTAMELAKRGRIQAAEDTDAVYEAGVADGGRPTWSDSPPPADEIVPKLRPGEFDEWVEDVAREMAARTVEHRHWYDLTDAEQAKWRRLATLAIGAVGTATITRTLRRIRARETVGPIDDLVGREALAFDDARGRAA